MRLLLAFFIFLGCSTQQPKSEFYCSEIDYGDTRVFINLYCVKGYGKALVFHQQVHLSIEEAIRHAHSSEDKKYLGTVVFDATVLDMELKQK